MQSLSKYNKGIKYLLCAIDLLNKYASVTPIKDKKGTSAVNAIEKIISKGRKPNKIWVDQGSQFYNQYFKMFLKINNIALKCIRHTMKESLLLLRYLLEHCKTRFLII